MTMATDPLWRTGVRRVTDWQTPPWAVREPVPSDEPAPVVSEPVVEAPPVELTLVQAEQVVSNALGIPAKQFATRDPARGITVPVLLTLCTSILEAWGAQCAALDAGTLKPLDALDHELRSHILQLSRDRSAAGRDLLLLRVTALSDNPRDWLFRASRMMGGRSLSEQVIQEYLDAMREKNIKRARRIIERVRTAPLPTRRTGVV